MAEPVIPLYDMSQDIQEAFPIAIILKYVVLCVSSGCYVIYGSGIFYSQWPNYWLTFITNKLIFQDLTLFFTLL